MIAVLEVWRGAGGEGRGGASVTFFAQALHCSLVSWLYCAAWWIEVGLVEE